MAISELTGVLLVSLDCARADVAYSGILRNLNRLRAFGATFTKTSSSSPFTPASHATVFSGQQPYEHGLRHLFREPISPTAPLLAEYLQDKGFRTCAIVSCPGLNRWYGFDRGFGHYDDELSSLPSGEDPLQVVDVKLRGLATKPAAEVSKRAIDWLSSVEPHEKFFTFVHFFDGHWPYKYATDLVVAHWMNDYERALVYADRELGRIIDFLASRSRLQSTLICVFGDHGEDLGGLYPNDKGGPSGPHPEEEGHGCLLYEATQHVPLVLSGPHCPNTTVKVRTGLVDIAPTIASLAGIVEWPQCSGVALVGRDPESYANRILYAETMHPQEVAATKDAFRHLLPLQARWLRDIKVIRRGGASEGYDLTTDQCELRPFSGDQLHIARVPWPGLA